MLRMAEITKGKFWPWVLTAFMIWNIGSEVVDEEEEATAITDNDSQTSASSDEGTPASSYETDRAHVWNSRLKELKIYKRAHGNCNVPMR